VELFYTIVGKIIHRGAQRTEVRCQRTEDRKRIYHGVTRSVTENIREWILFLKSIVDRINRILRNSFDRFPEEIGQSLSPSAKGTIVFIIRIRNISQ
jgi:hypothetical protein